MTREANTLTPALLEQVEDAPEQGNPGRGVPSGGSRALGRRKVSWCTVIISGQEQGLPQIIRVESLGAREGLRLPHVRGRQQIRQPGDVSGVCSVRSYC